MSTQALLDQVANLTAQRDHWKLVARALARRVGSVSLEELNWAIGHLGRMVEMYPPESTSARVFQDAAGLLMEELKQRKEERGANDGNAT